jgi:hypothetical protein
VGPRACREGRGESEARQRPEAQDIAKMKREEKVLRGDRVSVVGNSLYASARYARRWWWRPGGGEVVTLRRQKQARQLKDTWSIECFVSVSISSLLS